MRVETETLCDSLFQTNQGICVVVHSTLAHCAGAHTHCAEGVRKAILQRICGVYVGEYQVCGVRKMAAHKNLRIQLLSVKIIFFKL